MKFTPQQLSEHFSHDSKYLEYVAALYEYITEFSFLITFVMYIYELYDFENTDYDDIDIYCDVIASNIYILSCVNALIENMKNTPNVVTEKYSHITKNSFYSATKTGFWIYQGFMARLNDDDDDETYVFAIDKHSLKQSILAISDEIRSGFDSILVSVSASNYEDLPDPRRIVSPMRLSDLNYAKVRKILDKAEYDSI